MKPNFPTSLFLAALLVSETPLTMLATASAGPAAEAQKLFRAGAATSNITPPLGVSLDGVVGQGGLAKQIHDELQARCLVLDDGATRLAIVICDLTVIADDVLERAKTLAHERTGLPKDRMLIAATHTHSTPRAVHIGQGELDIWYHDFLAERIADGVSRAANNLAPARIGWGVGRKPEWVFNRRWRLQPGASLPNPFGEATDLVITNPIPGSEDLMQPAGPVDPEVAVLSVQHADGRPLALLANYGLHYVGGTPRGHVSADYFGVFADRIQQLLGADRLDPPFVGLMSNGTSGDVNSRNPRAPAARQPPYAAMRTIAFSVAEEAHRVYQKIEHRQWVPLAMRESVIELGVRRPSPERVAWARPIVAQSAGRKSTATKVLSRPEIYARETLALEKYPPTVSVKLQALRIGELGITAAPCEVFAETGLEIKARSPLQPAFMIELANGYHGYLPTPAQHALGGYETWPARSSHLEIEASSKIRDELLRLLTEVAASR